MSNISLLQDGWFDLISSSECFIFIADSVDTHMAKMCPNIHKDKWINSIVGKHGCLIKKQCKILVISQTLNGLMTNFH